VFNRLCSFGFCRQINTISESVYIQRGPLRLVSTTEELLERISSGFVLESREYGRRDSLRCSRDTPYPQKLALTSQEKRRSLGRNSSLADSDHGVFSFSLVHIQ
jgi:hypothetical protein